jgi:K+-sensing histidine kinase KdpD
LVPYIKIPDVTLFPAMVVCSLVGGRLAGILAAGVGGIIAWYLWLPPRGTFSLEWPTAQLTILLYVLTSTILLPLTHGLNETLKDLERSVTYRRNCFVSYSTALPTTFKMFLRC